MEKRTSFGEADIDYLANLCHDCRECYYACPFTPPHTFAVNIPKTLASARTETYKKFTRPKPLALLFEKQRMYGGLLLPASLLMFVFVAAMGDPSRLFVAQAAVGSFYGIIPFPVIAGAGLLSLGCVLLLWAQGALDYWREIHGSVTDMFNAKAIRSSLREAFAHTWFKGGGAGCNYPREEAGARRLYLHSMVFFGFGLDLLSTVSAAVYQDILGVLPPYGYFTAPVLLGTVGGVMIVAGTVGLTYLKAKSEKLLTYRATLDTDYLFMLLLGSVAFTGMGTLVLRDTPYMGIAFAIHMGFVLSVFLLAPYGKFLHFVYRYAALLKRGLEEAA